MTYFDPRLTPARPDLAAAHLRGKVEAAQFIEGVKQRIVWPAVPVRNIPSPDAPSMICLDKNTGKLVWRNNDPGKNIMHGQC